MNITEVKVRKLWPEGKIKAIVSITIDDSFVIHDIKMVEGQNGLFMAMPSRRTPDGKYRDIAHPLSQEVRNDLQEKIFAAYYEALEQMGTETESTVTGKAEEEEEEGEEEELDAELVEEEV